MIEHDVKDDLEFANDLLHGADEIARYLFGDPALRRKVYHLAATSNLPVFKLGAMIWINKDASYWTATEDGPQARSGFASAVETNSNLLALRVPSRPVGNAECLYGALGTRDKTKTIAEVANKYSIVAFQDLIVKCILSGCFGSTEQSAASVIADRDADLAMTVGKFIEEYTKA